MGLEVDPDDLAPGGQQLQVGAERVQRPEPAVQEQQRRPLAEAPVGELDPVDRDDTGAGGRGGHGPTLPRPLAYLVETWPQVRFIPAAVTAPAWSEARKAAARPTSARVVSRPSIALPRFQAISSSRVMAADPVP